MQSKNKNKTLKNSKQNLLHFGTAAKYFFLMDNQIYLNLGNQNMNWKQSSKKMKRLEKVRKKKRNNKKVIKKNKTLQIIIF